MRPQSPAPTISVFMAIRMFDSSQEVNGVMRSSDKINRKQEVRDEDSEMEWRRGCEE